MLYLFTSTSASCSMNNTIDNPRYSYKEHKTRSCIESFTKIMFSFIFHISFAFKSTYRYYYYSYGGWRRKMNTFASYVSHFVVQLILLWHDTLNRVSVAVVCSTNQPSLYFMQMKMKCTTDALVSSTATWNVTEETILVVFHFSIFINFRFFCFLFSVRIRYSVQKKTSSTWTLWRCGVLKSKRTRIPNSTVYPVHHEDREDRERKEINLECCDTKENIKSGGEVGMNVGRIVTGQKKCAERNWMKIARIEKYVFLALGIQSVTCCSQ